MDGVVESRHGAETTAATTAVKRITTTYLVLGVAYRFEGIQFAKTCSFKKQKPWQAGRQVGLVLRW